MRFALKRTSLFLAIICILGLVGLASAQVLPLAEQSETVISGDYRNGVVSGNYLYIASGYGLTIYDISVTTAPVFVTNLGTTGDAYDVAIVGSYAYIADAYNGIVVVDISDPTDPETVTELPLVGRARALAASTDNYLLVAMEEAGIALVDISDVPNLTVTSTIDTDDRAVDAAFQNGYFFVSDQDQLLSFSYTGGTLVQVSSFTTVTNSRGICFQGGDIVVAEFNFGIRYIDVTGGTFGAQTYQYTGLITATDVYPVGLNVAAGFGENGVSVLSPTGALLDNFSDIFEYAGVNGIFAWGNFIFAAENEFGFQLIDATSASTLTLESEVSIAGGPRNSVVYETAAGKFAFVAYHAGGVKVLNITDPRSPVLVTTIAIDGWCYDVDIVDNYLFVVEYWTGVYSYDITNPLTPVLLDQYLINPVGEDGTRACAIDGDYLYVVHYDLGLMKFDVSVPSNITLLGSLNTDGTPRDVKVDVVNDLAFVADYEDGCDIVDVSGNTPVMLAEYSVANELVRAVDFFDDVLYVGFNDGNVDLVDITTPASPVFISSILTSGDVNGLNVDGLYYLYVADWEKGVEVYNTSNPLSPQLVGSFDTHGLGKAGFIDGNYYHLSDSYSYYIFAIGGAVDVSIPADLLGIAGQNINIPIYVSDVSGLGVVSWEGAVSYDEAIMNYVGYNVTGTLCETGWTIVPNPQPGVINIGGFSTVAASGEGILVNLVFQVDPLAVIGSTTDWAFDSWQFNEGRPIDYTFDGMLEVTALYQVNGTAIYYRGAYDPIANMTISLTGDYNYTTLTSTSGAYLFPNVYAGNYTNNATRNETAYQPFWVVNFGDAVLAAQGAIGLITLTAGQTTAANVSGDATLSFFDASQIAQYAVHSLATGIHFQVALNNNSDWSSVPDFFTYAPLASNMTSNYLGIVYGDVDGNWTAGLVSSAPITDNSILSVPTTSFEIGESVTVAVKVNSNPSEAYFFQGEMLYNPELLEFQSISLASNLTSWTLQSNSANAGHLRFGAFNVAPLAAAGDVAYITFKVLDDNMAIELQLTNFFTKANSTVYNANGMISAANIPDAYALNQNYPNPFNPDTQIRFDIKDRGHVSLVIYNALGQKVRNLVDETLNPGVYSRLFDGKDDRGLELSSGLYFYQIKVNEFSDTRKMILVK